MPPVFTLLFAVRLGTVVVLALAFLVLWVPLGSARLVSMSARLDRLTEEDPHNFALRKCKGIFFQAGGEESND